MKTYGKITLDGDMWRIRCEPHVAMRLKRVCDGISKRTIGELTLSNTPDHCRDLAWFIERYPLEVHPHGVLERGRRQAVDRIERIADLLSGHVPQSTGIMAIPPRSYQAQGAALSKIAGGLLLADDVGLGKTCTAIASIVEQEHLPALIVVPANLLTQWRAEINLFAPHLHAWITPGKTPVALPEFLGNGPDVVITSYSRLTGWSEVLAHYCHSLVYDEVHELRRSGSQKYEAARFLAKEAAFRMRMGLSATPIFNYGGEFFWVMEALRPGSLGTREEFLREWCESGNDEKAKIKNPEAFGAWLRDQGLMLRRTRKDVGRELPAVTTVVQEVETDQTRLDEVGEQVRALAKILLGKVDATREERWKAHGELDWRLRQATGLAKAAYVADFVRLIVESGEPVVLYGWHRAVYDVWMDVLLAAGLRVACYTGGESVTEKDASAAAWKNGELDVMIISLRSGAGLDGLQKAGSVVVFGEIDWSPAVHEQCIGRLWRDGMTRPVIAYYLLSASGSDPVIADTLGVKRGQSDGIRNRTEPITEQADPLHIRRLAEKVLLSFKAKAGNDEKDGH